MQQRSESTGIVAFAKKAELAGAGIRAALPLLRMPAMR
jgi:hypothetical protein